MADKAVRDAMLKIADNISVKSMQIHDAAIVVSQFILVRQGLDGLIADERLDEIAAILTAGLLYRK